MRTAIVTRPLSWRGLLPLTNEQRVVLYRERLMHRADYRSFLHVDRVVRGVTWIEEFKRHKSSLALTIIDTEPGGNPAENNGRERGACAVGEES